MTHRPNYTLTSPEQATESRRPVPFYVWMITGCVMLTWWALISLDSLRRAGWVRVISRWIGWSGRTLCRLRMSRRRLRTLILRRRRPLVGPDMPIRPRDGGNTP